MFTPKIENMITAKIIRYKHKVLSDGTSPILLEIIFNRKIKRISLGYHCDTEQWNEDARAFTRKFADYKAKNKVLEKSQTRANDIIDDYIKTGKPFSFMAFEELYRGGKKNIPTLYAFFEERVKEMKAKNQLSNAQCYHSTKQVLKRFEPNPNVAFIDINYKFLTNFEIHLTENGSNGGGIINHMKTFRALMNEAIKRGYATQEQYPFKNQFNNNGYSFAHVKSDARPRALSLVDMERFKTFPIADYPHLNLGYKVFMFTYYARGINIGDIAKLQKTNIYDNRLHYTRSKTKHAFSFPLSEPLKAIIKEFEDDSSAFLFPFLSDFHKTPQQIKDRIAKITKNVNSQIKEVAKVLDINFNLTTYVGRHTYANTLKRNKVPTDMISETLGHADIPTTKAYLDNFQDEEIDKTDNLL